MIQLISCQNRSKISEKKITSSEIKALWNQKVISQNLKYFAWSEKQSFLKKKIELLKGLLFFAMLYRTICAIILASFNFLMRDSKTSNDITEEII